MSNIFNLDYLDDIPSTSAFAKFINQEVDLMRQFYAKEGAILPFNPTQLLKEIHVFHLPNGTNSKLSEIALNNMPKLAKFAEESRQRLQQHTNHFFQQCKNATLVLTYDSDDDYDDDYEPMEAPDFRPLHTANSDENQKQFDNSESDLSETFMYEFQNLNRFVTDETYENKILKRKHFDGSISVEEVVSKVFKPTYEDCPMDLE